MLDGFHNVSLPIFDSRHDSHCFQLQYIVEEEREEPPLVIQQEM